MKRADSTAFIRPGALLLLAPLAALAGCFTVPPGPADGGGSDARPAGDAAQDAVSDEPPLPPGELRAGRANQVGPVQVQASDDSLSRPIMMTAMEAPPPAPLPTGFTMAGDSVQINVSDANAVVAPLLVRIRYNPAAAGRWVTVLHHDPMLGYRPAMVVAQDAAAGTLTFQSRAFSPFVVASHNGTPPPAFTLPNFTPMANGWAIPNVGGAFTTNGNCLGMVTFAAWYYARPNAASQPGLAARFANPVVAHILAMRAQLASLKAWAWRPDTVPTPPAARAQQIATLKNHLATFGTPTVLLLRGRGRYNAASPPVPDAAHAVLAYGYDLTHVLAYDPNVPGQTVRLPYTDAAGFAGTMLDPGGATLFDMSEVHILAAPDWGRPDDFNELLAEADAGFRLSSDLTVETPMDNELIEARTYSVSGRFGMALPETSRAYVLAWGELFPVRVSSDRSFRGNIPMFEGSSLMYVLAGPENVNASPWFRGSAVRTVPFRATLPRAELLAMTTWDADESDLDMYLVAPDGRAIWWGRGFEDTNVGVLSIDNRDGYGPEYVAVSMADGHTVQRGEYRLRAHLHSDSAAAREGRPRNIRVTTHVVVQPPGVPFQRYRRCAFYISGADSTNAQPTDTGSGWRDIARVNILTGELISERQPDGSQSCAP